MNPGNTSFTFVVSKNKQSAQDITMPTARQVHSWDSVKLY